MERGVSDWLMQCSLPDNTELQEHTLKTDRCIVIGDRCKIDYGLQGDDVVICEFCSINGNILADGDVRIDNFCEIRGDVVSRQDAYLGEGVTIQGRLVVSGDLDIGDNVIIEKGFEAKGWISIRNPMPVIAYIVLYLVALLGIEKEEELDNFMKEFFGDDDDEGDDRQAAGAPLMIPTSSVLTMEKFSVPGTMTIGTKCRLHGNIRADSIHVMEEATIFGSLKAKERVTIADLSTVHGDVTGGGPVQISAGVHVLGDVRCGSLVLHENARVDGTIRAPEGVRIERAA
ncbi:MAG: acyltransferase [Methanoculleus sp. SDB]|nr:MAG: acyltransferase [Methanoculleus sp. SDB]